MSLFVNSKKIYQILRVGSAWRRSNALELIRPIMDPNHNKRKGYTDNDHLLAAIEWLKRAQDVTGDGGVAGRYSLQTGWSSSYPETTGYIIPTFLNLSDNFNQKEFQDRAGSAVKFLLNIQFDSGAFPGGEIGKNRTTASVFNTAQIITGLRAWHECTGDKLALDAALRACDWLVSTQGDDGVWREGLYGDILYVYMAHASCWIAELGRYVDNEKYLTAARLHLEWVLTFYNPETGWFDNCGFTKKDHEARIGVTHTIAYTIWGVLKLSQILGHDEGIRAACNAANNVARRLELSRWLPGKLDSGWRKKANWACLTGNAQMALIWFELFKIDNDPTWISVACKALDLVKRSQPMKSNDPGICGGIAGSSPIWGDYIYMKFPNWAAKFFIDAMLEKDKILKNLKIPVKISSDFYKVETKFSASSEGAICSREQRVVILTRPGSIKGKQVINAWSSWGFRPHCVFVAKPKKQNLLVRIQKKISQDGVVGIIAKFSGCGNSKKINDSSANIEINGDNESIIEFCKKLKIRVVEIGPLTTDEAIKTVKAEQPDLAVFAGGGILRKKILETPRLGVLNAHMGILPHFRGMNVAEWSCLMGEEVGCTIHIMDEGIDTGDILYVKKISIRSAHSIDEMRSVVREGLIEALGEVVSYSIKTGQLPQQYVQEENQGKQYFSMHHSLKELLNKYLSET